MRVVGSRPDVRLWTITQGGGLNPSGRFQMFGARKGVADICGILSPNGHCIAFEVKVGNDRLRPEQSAFLEMINRFGGIGREVRSVADCLAVLP